MDNEDAAELLQNDWLEIQSVSSASGARWFKNEDFVVIKESFFTDSAMFPPDSHEDLPLDSLNREEQVEGGPSQILPPSPSGDRNGGEVGESEVEVEEIEKEGRWTTTRAGLGFFSSAIGKIASGMKGRAVLRASLWWFTSVTTGVGALALVVVLYRRAKRWRQRKVQPESNHQLMLLIKSKDEKINELLLQVSQLNDMLLARRRVPVLQVG